MTHRSIHTMHLKQGVDRRALSLAAFLWLVCVQPGTALPLDAPGLGVTYTVDGKSHQTTVSRLALYVGQGESPTPFLPPQRFTAVWEGNVSADLRGEFFFQAEGNGRFSLEIKGANVLEATLANNASPLTKAVSLNKGANKLKAVFESPAAGDAYIRLQWTEKGTNTSPIPPSLLTHASTPELEKSTQIELGRELFFEHRCVKCHIEAAGSGAPETAMDAPSFEGIGARRTVAWMARWILDPKAERRSAHMPKLANTLDEAQGMAAFLGSLRNGADQPRPKDADSPPPPEGKTLFEA